jgi:hypothetical protein
LLDATCLAQSPVFHQRTPATLAETFNSLIGVGLLNHLSNDALVGIELHPVVRDIRWRQQDAVRDEPHYRTTCLQFLDHTTEEGAYGNPQVWQLENAVTALSAQRIVRQRTICGRDRWKGALWMCSSSLVLR